MDKKIILFELNEVPLRIIDQFCQWHPKSCLAQKLSQCRTYETYAEDTIRLSPWVTWPSLYRGVSDDRHTISHFGQELSEIDEQFPPLWKILTKNGITTGVFGSLHSYPMPENLENYAFYVPDTFAAGSECFPDDLSLFQQFNLKMSRKSPRNVSTKIHWRSALSMLTKAPELGFKLKTFVDTASQLAVERVQRWKRIRRRTYQTVLAIDIFLKQLAQTKPDFCTFFTNHVASSLHRYWAAAFPKDYDEFEFTDGWVNRYRNEIEFTMCKFDQMLSQLVKFVHHNPEYNLWITTSMGQAATIAEPLETQLYITDLTTFLKKLGVEKEEWEERPAMAPRVSVFVKEHKQDILKQALASMRVNDKPIEYHCCSQGFFNIRFGQENLHTSSCLIEIDGDPVSFADIGMELVAIEDLSNSTANHIPQGSLLIYDPQQIPKNTERTQISALDLAPSILANFSVNTPEYMNEPVTL